MNKGLYQSDYEHDACGVGMIVNIHGNKSHELVDNALKVLENMRHRGAEGADNKTGDGAGIMLQIPHEFILLQGIPVPEKGKYGTGLVFLPNEPITAEQAASILQNIWKLPVSAATADASDWTADALRALAEAGISMKDAEETLTRLDAARLFYQINKLK